MKKFALLTNYQVDEDLSVTHRIEEYINGHGGSCWLPRPLPDGYYDVSDMPDDIDCALTLGGDGTFLNAARRLRSRKTPLFGINLGNLGYLTSAEADDIPECLVELLEDRYRIDERMMLRGKVMHVSGETVTDTALNDIVISRAGALRVVEFRIFVDGDLLSVYDADGIIVSTATGSTGYNLSAGGPVVMPNTSVMVVTPICPHTLQTRSVIVSAGSRVRIAIGRRRKTQNEEAAVTFDGTMSEKMSIIDSVEITRAREKTRILRRPESGFCSIFNNSRM